MITSKRYQILKKRIARNLQKITTAFFQVIEVRRPNAHTLQSKETAVTMRAPAGMSLEEIARIVEELEDTYPCAEEHFLQTGANFLCYNEKVARKLGAYGFIHHKKTIAHYQRWGQAPA